MVARQPLDATKFKALVGAESDVNADRIHYCYQIGSTFVHLSLLEDAIINAMAICDKIKVSKLLGGADSAAWELLHKQSQFQSSTLGTLITILSKHGVAATDIAYLKWVKSKRDFFIHRFFHEGAWPGELETEHLHFQCRKLLYLELIFTRASHRIWKIFGRASLLDYVDLGESGALLTQVDLADRF